MATLNRLDAQELGRWNKYWNVHVLNELAGLFLYPVFLHLTMARILISCPDNNLTQPQHRGHIEHEKYIFWSFW